MDTVTGRMLDIMHILEITTVSFNVTTWDTHSPCNVPMELRGRITKDTDCLCLICVLEVSSAFPFHSPASRLACRPVI